MTVEPLQSDKDLGSENLVAGWLFRRASLMPTLDFSDSKCPTMPVCRGARAISSGGEL